MEQCWAGFEPLVVVVQGELLLQTTAEEAECFGCFESQEWVHLMHLIPQASVMEEVA